MKTKLLFLVLLVGSSLLSSEITKCDKYLYPIPKLLKEINSASSKKEVSILTNKVYALNLKYEKCVKKVFHEKFQKEQNKNGK
jgi:hypothetical protein